MLVFRVKFLFRITFRIIRAAIDGAKNPIDKLGQFFKNYAIINLITIVFSLIASLYQRLLPEMYIVYALINLAVYLIAFSIDKELSIENITIHYQDLYYSFVCLVKHSKFLDGAVSRRWLRKRRRPWERIQSRLLFHISF